MDATSLTLFLSLLLSGNLDQQPIQDRYGSAQYTSLALVGAGVTVLVAGGTALTAYGVYALWGRVMAASNAFGFSPLSAIPAPPAEPAPAPANPSMPELDTPPAAPVEAAPAPVEPVEPAATPPATPSTPAPAPVSEAPATAPVAK